jgi:thiol-disulfide isomerase/thioredoxin
MRGENAVQQVLLSNVAINNDVENSIANYKEEFTAFEMIPEKPGELNKILNSKLAPISLPNVLNGENETVKFLSDKITLIDFWEVWCGPCIESFPKVEKIKNTYSDRLQVIGMVTEDKETAIKLMGKKGITFLNLFASKDYLEKFNVKGYPSYFLIDNKGIVQKEYFRFSGQIEADIKSLIAK